MIHAQEYPITPQRTAHAPASHESCRVFHFHLRLVWLTMPTFQPKPTAKNLWEQVCLSPTRHTSQLCKPPPPEPWRAAPSHGLWVFFSKLSSALGLAPQPRVCITGCLPDTENTFLASLIKQSGKSTALARTTSKHYMCSTARKFCLFATYMLHGSSLTTRAIHCLKDPL